MWTSCAVSLFLSLLLLSESTAASVGAYRLQIAQQTVPPSSVPLSPDKQQRYQEGVKLYQEAQELRKKGTKEGYQQALEKYQQVLKIVQELGLRKDEVDLLANIANVYYSMFDNKNAIESLKKALQISRELKQPIWEAIALGSIGNMYTNSNDPKEGLTYLQKAQSILLAHKEYGSLATTLNSIATIYMRIDDIKKALVYRNEALKIYRETLKDSAKEASTLQSIAVTYSLSGETRTALNYYEQALKIQRQRKDFSAQVKIISEIAALQDKLGNTKKALESLKEALKLQEQAGFEISEKANTLAQIGHIYAGQADYLTAIDYYQQAGKLWQQAGDTQLVSMSFQMIANVHKNFSGDYETALEFLDKALKLQLDDKDNQAFTLGQKADVHLSRGNYQKALEEYNKALELQRSIPNPKSEARTLNNIALLYRNLGDYQSSINTYNKALDIFRRISSKNQEIQTLGFIASVYQFQDKYDEALASYKQALSLSSKDNYQSKIQILQGMAQTYKFLNDYPNALESANRALKLSQENSFGEEHSLTVLASVYRAKGDYQKSLNISEKVLAHYRTTGLRIREAQMLGDISITYEQQKNYQKAIDIRSEELKIRRELKENKAEASALYGIAINQRKLGKLEAALPNVEEAIKIVENIRGNVESQDLRTSYFATVQGYYKFYIDLLMELHKKDPSKICEFTTKDQNTNKDITIKDKCKAVALHISERSRARGLVELLTEARANIRKGANPELLAQESRLKDLINTKEKLRQEIVNSDKADDPIYKARADKFQTEIDELLSQQKQLETKIRQSSPKYANLKYPQPLTLPQIQQQLDKDTLLLEYSLGNDRSYLWAVTPNSIDTYELPPRKEIEEAATKFRNDLQQPTGGDLTALSATKLSKIILGDVADKLGKKRLVIVADGGLQKIPFAALNDVKTFRWNVSTTRDISKTEVYQPLIVNHEIVNLPSVTAIATQRQELKGRKTAPKTLAILADPVFEATDTRITDKPESIVPNSDFRGNELNQSALKQAARNLNRNGWVRLKGTETEANAILKLVPSDNLQAFGFEANYNWVTNKQLSQYRFLHFATHGFADPNNPELSGIVLSLFLDKQGKPANKGYLRLGDIFNLDFAADLIVLSACETGLGKDVNGEGLVGLTRGLMYAGAERVAVSLWKVDDAGTAELMKQFYTEMLKQGKSPTDALRAAQLKLWENSSLKNPYYWSAFTLQGEWR
jgi:CHAT domain-containing protein/Tfp pilus assembly protein PilF